MKEGYSREAFEENENRIDASRELARLRLFGAAPIGTDPADILTAKFDYAAGKQERALLLSEAWDEAILENNARISGNHNEVAPSYCVGDFSKIVIETESGNTYTVQKNSNGQGYSVTNAKNRTITTVPDDQIANNRIAKGANFYYGVGANTTAVKSAKLWK